MQLDAREDSSVSASTGKQQTRTRRRRRWKRKGAGHESRWQSGYQTGVGRAGNESIPQLDGPGGSSSEESDEGSDESDEVGVAYCDDRPKNSVIYLCFSVLLSG